MCWYCIVIIPYFQRPRHRDRKRYGSHSIAPGLRRRGVPPWEDSNACPWHGTSSSAENGTITEQSRVGPQTTDTSFCLAAGGASAGMVRKVPTVSQAPGPSTAFRLPTLPPPSVLGTVSASRWKSGGLDAGSTREGTPVFSLVLCPSAFVYHPERYPNRLTSASATVWPAVRFSNHGVPHPLCPPKLLILIIVTP